MHSKVIRCLYPVAEGGAGLAAALDEVRAQASAAIADGARVIILSDRESNEQMAPIPALLAVAGGAPPPGAGSDPHPRGPGGRDRRCPRGAPHGAADRVRRRGGQPVPGLRDRSRTCSPRASSTGIDREKALSNYVKAAGKGVLKVMSKMGISTVASYTGAQVFEAVGLGRGRVDEYFTGTASPIGGIGLDDMAAEVAARHQLATWTGPSERAHRELEVGGEYQWRREGEYHLFNPETVFRLQHATRARPATRSSRSTPRLVDDQARTLATLRGLLDVPRPDVRPPVPLDEVEPASRDREAVLDRGHVLRLDLRRGARDPGHRDEPDGRPVQHRRGRRGRRSGSTPTPTGTGVAARSSRSPRRGSASPRTTWSTPTKSRSRWPRAPSRARAASCRGTRCTRGSPKTRHSTPGVGLISPPPHHDIYSIEDLAQLIHDLKNANPSARVHVKLVSEMGVGTVAAGVSKAHADVVLISGHDGGTGATPLTSLKHAGVPRGSSGWPRRSRPCCSTGYATGSWSRWTASSRRVAT